MYCFEITNEKDIPHQEPKKSSLLVPIHPGSMSLYLLSFNSESLALKINLGLFFEQAVAKHYVAQKSSIQTGRAQQT
jgi:hypothetical protein